MKKFSFLAFIAASVATSAFASPGSMYIGAEGGYQISHGDLVSQLYQSTTSREAEVGSLKYNKLDNNSKKIKKQAKAPVGSLRLGYVVSDDFRTDLAFSFNAAELRGKKEGFKAKLETWNVMANFYYDLQHFGNFAPFLGFGVGYGSNTLDPTHDFRIDDSEIPAEFKASSIKDASLAKKTSKRGVVFGATLGMSYKVSEKLYLQLDYRLTKYPAYQFNTPEFNSVAVPANSASFSKHIKFNSLAHSLNAGIRLVF